MKSKTLRIAKRYARALLLLAIEHNVHDRAFLDMQYVEKVFGMDKEIRIILESPIIHSSRKQNIIKRLFGEATHPIILKYLLIIARKGRSSLLDDIANQYISDYKRFKGIEEVCITTALPLDLPLRQKALQAAACFTTREIEFEEKVDPSIIGGFILDFCHGRYNASVSNKLYELRKQMNLH